VSKKPPETLKIFHSVRSTYISSSKIVRPNAGNSFLDSLYIRGAMISVDHVDPKSKIESKNENPFFLYTNQDPHRRFPGSRRLIYLYHRNLNLCLNPNPVRKICENSCNSCRASVRCAFPFLLSAFPISALWSAAFEPNRTQSNPKTII